MNMPHGQRPTEPTGESKQLTPAEIQDNIAALSVWAHGKYKPNDYFAYPSVPPAVLQLEDTLEICDERVGALNPATAQKMVEQMRALALTLVNTPEFKESEKLGIKMLAEERAKRVTRLAGEAIERK